MYSDYSTLRLVNSGTPVVPRFFFRNFLFLFFIFLIYRVELATENPRVCAQSEVRRRANSRPPYSGFDSRANPPSKHSTNDGFITKVSTPHGLSFPRGSDSPAELSSSRRPSSFPFAKYLSFPSPLSAFLLSPNTLFIYFLFYFFSPTTRTRWRRERWGEKANRKVRRFGGKGAPERASNCACAQRTEGSKCPLGLAAVTINLTRYVYGKKKIVYVMGENYFC